ncbi:MAG: hypothetical protein NVSMB68_09080 [Thermoanaerobaculia bacterium]
MVVFFYAGTAAILLALSDRLVTRLRRSSAAALILLPLLFTGRAVLTDRIYAPVEMAYLAQPLRDHAAASGVGAPHNGAISDIAFQMIPWREATRRAFADREWPLLNRFELCGDVLAGAAQPAVFNPFTIIACVLPTPLSFTYTGAIAFFLAGLGAFLFARELGCSDHASLFAAAGWMFSGPVALQILWPQGFAWNLLPLVMLATHRIVHCPDRRSITLLTTVLSLEVLAGHPESLMHVVAISAAYGLLEVFCVRPRISAVRVAAVGMATIISGVAALGVTAIYLLPFLDAVGQTREFAMRTLVLARMPLRVEPGFVRDALLGDPFPWLRTASSRLPEDIAAGSIIVALALGSILFVRARRTWFFVALFVVALLAGAKAWPVAPLLHAIPLFDRALNERMATAAPLALSMLAAFAVDRLVPRRLVLACVALLAVYAVVMATLPTHPAGIARLLADLVPLVIAIGVAMSDSLPLLPTLLTLLLVQRVVADGSLVPVNDNAMAYPRLALFEPLRSVRQPFRIAGTGSALLPNTATMYGLEDVRGHTPLTFAPLADTFPLWSRVAAGEFHSLPDLTHPMLAMMNVRFGLQNVSEPLAPGWREVKREMSTRLVENDHVLDRAFVPQRVRIGTPAEGEIDEMKSEGDFGARAWLQIPEPRQERDNGSGAVSVARQPNGLRIDVAKGGDGFVVISEAAWRGWRGYVDGKRVQLHRANHAFLAVFVTAGRHTIDVRYLPQSFLVGRFVSLMTLLIYSTVTLFARFRG